MGFPLDEAVAMTSAARGLPVPETAAQRDWLMRTEARHAAARLLT